jgi:HD-like signal output (HDOD) protein
MLELDTKKIAQQPSSEIIRPSILFIVENEPHLQRTREIFRKERLQLLFCSTFSDAMEQLRNTHVDLIVLESSRSWNEIVQLLKQAQSIRGETIRLLIGTAEHESDALESIATNLLHQYVVNPMDDELYYRIVMDTIRVQHEVRLRKLRIKLASFRSLPSPERFQSRLQLLLSKRDISINALVEEIEKSPALVAKVLQVANSVHYWIRVPIAKVHDAVAFIGTEHIASLVMAIEVFDTIGHSNPPDIHAHYELLWERSLRRANIAKKIAEEWKQPDVQPHMAYVAALLQDVGLLIRLSNEPQRYLQMLQIMRETGASPAESELRVFSNTHYHVGGLVLQTWNFPPKIVFAIAHHHSCTFDDPLTQTIQIADALYTPDIIHSHDPSIDPMLEIWRSRFESADCSALLSTKQ